MTRIQQERFSLAEYQSLKDNYILNPASLQKAKSKAKFGKKLHGRINGRD